MSSDRHWLRSSEREFVFGAAVSLLLDLPFLVICLGVMLRYSGLLTSNALAVRAVVAAVHLHGRRLERDD